MMCRRWGGSAGGLYTTHGRVNGDHTQQRQGEMFLLFRVIIQVGDNLTEFVFGDFAFFAFDEEIVVADVGHKVGHVDEVVDLAVDVGDGRLVGRMPPFIVHDELEGMLTLFQIVYVREVVARSVHGDLTLPVVERAGDVHVLAAVFPFEDSRNKFTIWILAQRHWGRIWR